MARFCPTRPADGHILIDCSRVCVTLHNDVKIIFVYMCLNSLLFNLMSGNGISGTEYINSLRLFLHICQLAF